MLNRYQSLGLLSTFVILSFSGTAFADQRSYQRVSGATSATGENAASLSRSEQSVYQSGPGSQQLWQSAEIGTLAAGQDASALTQVTQSASQSALSDWADAQTLELLQSAGLSTQALGDWSQAENTAQQAAEQFLTDF